MNSKDKPTKPTKPSKSKLIELLINFKLIFVVLPLMTPRNLVPATPMRFNSGEELSKKPVIQVKEKKVVPLPPGYVDRAAQRRQGIDSSINFEDLQGFCFSKQFQLSQLIFM